MKQKVLAILSVSFLSLLFVFAANAQTGNNSNKNEQKTEKQEKDRPLKIKRKPHPSVGRCGKIAGTTILRVTFDKSAKVTDVEIVSLSGCDSFDKNSVEAAKAIKFEPQIKDGEPITVTKRIEYAFEIR